MTGLSKAGGGFGLEPIQGGHRPVPFVFLNVDKKDKKPSWEKRRGRGWGQSRQPDWPLTARFPMRRISSPWRDLLTHENG